VVAHRCGIEPGAPALALARRVAACGNLRFAGLHAYHGPPSMFAIPGSGAPAIAAATEKARSTKTLIENAGIACETITGAGTGTFMHEGAKPRLQRDPAGLLCVYGRRLQSNLWEDGWPRFEQSLFRARDGDERAFARHAVLDAGLKASSVDSGLPQVHHGREWSTQGRPTSTVWLKIAAAAKVPKLGEKLLLVPGTATRP